MSEKHHIEKVVCDLAEAHGWFVRKVAWAGRRNAPDRIFAKREGTENRQVWIEFKDRGKSARSTQSSEHREMAAAGMDVHVCDSIRSACAILNLPFTPDPLRPHL